MLNQVASKDKKKKDKKRKHARGGDTPAHEERSEEDKVKKIMYESILTEWSLVLA